MRTKNIIWFGTPATVACDGKCDKAWGVTHRPRIRFDEKDPDDFAFLADAEFGTAPEDPGTYEGGHAKPLAGEEMNKWCTRECERTTFKRVSDPAPIDLLPNFSVRRFNQPFKHAA